MLFSFIFTVLLAQMSAAAPTPVPNPSIDLTPLAYMQGTWTCHSMLRGKDRPDTYTGAMALNGRYIVAHDTAPPFDQYRTAAVNSEFYYTYDPQNKRYISTEMDDFGGYGFATSSGWQGNNIVWTDKSAPDGSVAVTTITKLNDSEYNLKTTGTDGQGKPIPTTTATCKKS